MFFIIFALYVGYQRRRSNEQKRDQENIDTYETISTLEGICEGNEVFLVKRWKRKSNGEFQGNSPGKDETERLNRCLCIIDDDKVAETHCTEFDKWDMMIPISEALLNDLMINYSSYRNELNQQLVVKERLFYVLKKAKDQRSRLRGYENNLRDERRYAEKRLRETAELMTSKITTMSTDDVSSMLDETNDNRCKTVVGAMDCLMDDSTDAKENIINRDDVKVILKVK